MIIFVFHRRSCLIKKVTIVFFLPFLLSYILSSYSSESVSVVSAISASPCANITDCSTCITTSPECTFCVTSNICISVNETSTCQTPPTQNKDECIADEAVKDPLHYLWIWIPVGIVILFCLCSSCYCYCKYCRKSKVKKQGMYLYLSFRIYLSIYPYYFILSLSRIYCMLSSILHSLFDHIQFSILFQIYHNL